MEKKKKPAVKHSKRHKGKTEMVTSDGILIWVPDKKVEIKKSWGWKTVSDMKE